MVISEINVNPVRNHDQNFKIGDIVDHFAIFTIAVVGNGTFNLPVTSIFVTKFDPKNLHLAAKNHQFADFL